MNGIIYTKLLEMTEEKFGYKIADKIIFHSNLQSKGIYTSIDSYSEEELFILLDALSNEVNIEKKELMILLGEKLYITFVENYSLKLLLLESNIPFLERFENYINLEIARILEKEKTPKICINCISEQQLIMTYHVEQHIAELIEGLILGSLNICNKKIGVQKINLLTNDLMIYKFILENK